MLDERLIKLILTSYLSLPAYYCCNVTARNENGNKRNFERKYIIIHHELMIMRFSFLGEPTF